MHASLQQRVGRTNTASGRHTIMKRSDSDKKLLVGSHGRVLQVGAFVVFISLISVALLFKLNSVQNTAGSVQIAASVSRQHVQELLNHPHLQQNQFDRTNPNGSIGFPELLLETNGLGGNLRVRMGLEPRSQPMLRELRWEDRQSSWRQRLSDVTPLSFAVVQKGVPDSSAEARRASKCLVASSPTAASINDNEVALDCEGLQAKMHVSAIGAGPYGAALRIYLRAGVPVSSVEVTMWLPGAAVEGSVDGSPITSRQRPQVSLISLKCDATASSSFAGKWPSRLVDGDEDTEWFAAKGEEEAWIILDLGEERLVSAVQIHWWGISCADVWKLESKCDDTSDSWQERAASSNPVSDPFNARVNLPGWDGLTRYLRLTMSSGHMDPWNFGVLFGIRAFDVFGKDVAATAGPSELWEVGGVQKTGNGFWLALEHPRARCSMVGQPEPRKTLGKAVWRLARCELKYSELSFDSFDAFISLGVFQDAEHSQLRRVFSTYLEAARGRMFGQNLHYNSWYDLSSSRCPQGQTAPDCNTHYMTESACMERIKAFNGNLTKFGGPPLDSFLLDDGWDNATSLWDIDSSRFPSGFMGLQETAQVWGTRLGLWMSPFGGYGAAASQRLRNGASQGFENSHGSFSLAGPKYFSNFRAVVERRIEEGFGIFKFDGIGGGLEQQGGDSYIDDFEAMLTLTRGIYMKQNLYGLKPIWVSLTIGSWPSPFWLLSVDSIWRDGPDVGLEGVGSQREQWLTFRDSALRRALRRGPLFPVSAFMQHGVVWSRGRETVDMWMSKRPDRFFDFCHEVLTLFLSGTGLQELYIQLELVTPRYWSALARIAAYARNESSVLRDAHPIGGYPKALEPYGSASFLDVTPLAASRGVFWWRNPSDKQQNINFDIAEILELPAHFLRVLDSDDTLCWELRPVNIARECKWRQHPPIRSNDKDPAQSCRCSVKLFGPRERINTNLEPFGVYAWEAVARSCRFQV